MWLCWREVSDSITLSSPGPLGLPRAIWGPPIAFRSEERRVRQRLQRLPGAATAGVPGWPQIRVGPVPGPALGFWRVPVSHALTQKTMARKSPHLGVGPGEGLGVQLCCLL